MVSPYRSSHGGKADRKESRQEVRVKDEGESERRSVMERIRGATSPGAKASRLPSGLSSRENLSKPTKEAKQMTAESRQYCWCGFPRPSDWHAIDWQAVSRKRASAPGAYREGNAGRQMGQGQSLATSAHPLVLRQSPCCSTSDGKPGQETPGVDGDHLEHAPEESNGRKRA